MSAEELLLRFQAAYPGVYLSVHHTVRLLAGGLKHEWMLWHAGAGEHVGPYPDPSQLAAAVAKWEESGERQAACEVAAAEQLVQERRQRLAKERIDDERRRVADPSYVPTVEEAARHPKEFVEGMTKERKIVVVKRKAPGIDPRD